MKFPDKLLPIIVQKQTEEKEAYYIYLSDIIRANCQMFSGIPYQPKSIHFASMANSNKNFLTIVKEEGLSAFANSKGHYRLLQDAGFSGKDIVFTASAMDKENMQFLKETGSQVNLDSYAQLLLWKKLFPNTKTGIRCNIGDYTETRLTRAGYFIGKESRLGFNALELEKIKGDPIINGLHLYVGTDIMDVDYFMKCYNALLHIAKLFPNIEYLNLGGGFGIDEKGESVFNMQEYSKKVSELMQKVEAELGKTMKLILEPGRIIGGNAGFFVCRVTDIKPRDDHYFVGVNASSVQFPRPLLYPDDARHPLLIIRNGKIVTEGEMVKLSVYGCSTYSRDFLRKDALLPLPEIGDTLVFGNAGSYSASSYLEFLGFPKPKEFFV